MSKKVFYGIFFLLLVSIAGVVGLMLSSADMDSPFKAPLPKVIASARLPHPEKIRIQKNKCPAAPGKVNIVLVTDSRYVTPTAVSMYSAIKNKCPQSTYNFYIVAEEITRRDENMLLNLQKLAPGTVHVKIIPQQELDLPYENMQRFMQYKVGMHKIFLPDTLKELDKVIYMDGDTLVLKDLRELFDIDVSTVYAAVAKDGIFYRFPKEMAEIGLDKRGFYFNSGVMLYNLKLQRQDNVVAKLVEYVKTHEDFFGDQDVLNVVFGSKLKLMSYRYNCISTFFEEDDLVFLSRYFGEELPRDTFYIYENATVIHYAGDKPWQDNYKPEFLKELWFRYFNEVVRL